MKEPKSIGHLNSVTSISFSFDSRKIVTASLDGTARLWEVGSGQLLKTLVMPRHGDFRPGVDRVGFTPDDETIVCTLWSRVVLWRLGSGVVDSFPDDSCERLVLSRSGLALSIHQRKEPALWVVYGWRRLRAIPVVCNYVEEAALSHQGIQVALVGDGKLTLINGDTGKVRWSIPFASAHAKATVAFSPDDRLLACATGSDPPRMFDAATGRSVTVLGGVPHPRIGSGSWYHHLVSFSPDGAVVVTAGDDGALCLWDAVTGKRLRSISQPGVSTHRIDPETGSDKSRPAAHDGCIRSVTFSPNGDLLASGGDDYTVNLWRTASGTRVTQLGERRNQVTCLALSNVSGSVIVGMEDGSMRLWDRDCGTLNLKCLAHAHSVTALCLTSNAKTVVTASADGEVNTWELPSGRLLNSRPGSEGSVESLALSPDDVWLASGGWQMRGERRVGQVRLWKLKTGDLGPAIDEWGEVTSVTCRRSWRVEAVAISPDSNVLATGVAREVMLWDMKTGRPSGRLRSEGDPFSARIISLAFSPDGTILAGGTVGYDVYLWETATETLTKRIRANRDSIRELMFTPDGSFIAICTHYDSIVWVYPVETGELLGTFEGHVNSVSSLAFSTDGSILVTGSEDGFVGVWDYRTREPLRFLR